MSPSLARAAKSRRTTMVSEPKIATVRLPMSLSASATTPAGSLPARRALPTPEQLELLGAVAAAADDLGELQPAQVALIHRSRWLRLLAPCEFGGDERPLPDVVRLEEAIARVDGSCGWVVTLCAGAGWFAGFLPSGLARRILATPDVCLAGSGAPTGYADRDGDGWQLSGRWRHASGSQIATHFTLNAQLREGGLPVLDQRGQPRVRAFVVPAAAVVVEPHSWHSIGLRASTSRAFSLTDFRVGADHAFDIDASVATVRHPLYRFPFRSLAFVTLTACLVGMARNFVDLAKPLVDRRIAHLDRASSVSAELWRSGDQSLQAAREAFYAELDCAWRLVERNEHLDTAQEHRLEEVSQALVRVARKVVNSIYPCCGLYAADPRSDINRVWRDFHTATQHALWLR